MSSKSSSRSKYSHFCIGSSTSVLKDDFVLAFETDEKFDIKSWLPFTGKMKLPTQMEVLKLILFLRDEAGRKNQWVRAGDIYRSVAEVVQRYWARAGFITKSNIERDVEKIHQEYKLLLKNKNKTTQSFVKSREEFLMSENEKGEKIEKLFDVGHKDLEKTLEQDRIRGNLGVQNEDLSFLKDQRGERKSFMAGEDKEYQKKKESQLKRKMGPAPATVTSSCQTSEAASLPDDEEEEDSDEEEDSEDEERNRRPKRSKLVDIQLPRNIMASPQVSAALDRTNTTPAQAMHLFSAVLKSAKKDGESLDLNEVTLSKSTIRRGRQKAREEICRQQYQEFQDNMPEFLAVHWDGKMMKDLSQELREMEAILVSGNPGYNEGKLLGKNIK